MKIIVNKNSLLKSLGLVIRIIGTKNINPVLINFKFVVYENKMEIIGSNGSVNISDTINSTDKDGNSILSIERQGSFLVASRIIEIVRKLDGKDIVFELVDNSILRIDDNKSSFKLNTIDAKEYPDFEQINTTHSLTLSSEQFIKIVDQVAFAASIKESRPILKAVNIKNQNGEMSFSSTDTVRLSRKTVSVPFNKEINLNVPAKVLQDVSKMLEGISEIKIAFEENKISFLFDTTTVTSNVIEGDYPNLSSIINKTYGYVLKISTDEFIAALERVSALFFDRDTVVTLQLATECVKLTSKQSQIGSAQEILSNCEYEGDDLEISFNAHFLLDSLRALKSNDVEICFSGLCRPFSIKDPNDTSLMQIVTPLRIYNN